MALRSILTDIAYKHEMAEQHVVLLKSMLNLLTGYL